jgi:hypothetical protein
MKSIYVQPTKKQIDEIPVLVIAYKKLDTTSQVVECLRQVKSKNIFVALNAPNLNSPSDIADCKAVEQLFDTLNWESEITVLRREEHLPIAISYLTACDWFFDQNEVGIVLDDDCVPSSEFFRLVAYFHQNRHYFPNIGHINGTNFLYNENLARDAEAFFLTRYPSCWGWATWSDEWKRFNRDLRMQISREKLWLICKQNSGDKLFSRRAFWILDSFRGRSLEDRVAPDWLWTLHLWSTGRQIACPATNLVKNLGIGDNKGVTAEWTEGCPNHFQQAAHEGANLSKLQRIMILATEKTGKLPELIGGGATGLENNQFDRLMAKLYVSVSQIVRWKFYLGELLRMLLSRSKPY